MSDVTDPGLELWERMEPVEGFSVEYLHGEIIMMATPNTIHNRIVTIVRNRFPEAGFAQWTTQALAITGHSERPDPDLTITPIDLVDEFFKAIPSELVLFVLEVVSTSKPGIRRDYEEKPEIYAQGRIPVYLIVDPNNGTWLLHTEPDPAGGGYRTCHKGIFGEPVPLPAPLGLTVPTDRFRTYPTE